MDHFPLTRLNSHKLATDRRAQFFLNLALTRLKSIALAHTIWRRVKVPEWALLRSRWDYGKRQNENDDGLPIEIFLSWWLSEEFTLIIASWVRRARWREIRRFVLEFKASYFFLNSYIWCFLFEKGNLRVQRNNTLNLECKEVRDQFFENLDLVNSSTMIREGTRKCLRGLVPTISRRLKQGMPTRIFFSSIVIFRSLANV